MITVETIRTMKKQRSKIVCLTAYDYPTAKILDESGIDIILVGDSAANVFAGEKTTLPITMEEMLYHTKVVSHAVHNALVIADMPFLSFQVSESEAIYNAGRFLKAGASGVKLEGTVIAGTIKKLVDIGIPVMGHIGLVPQSIHKFGGYKLQGSTRPEASKLLREARLLASLGCFSIVLEKIPAALARRITGSVKIPTIGIGAGIHCDGQILVLQDMLGLFEDFTPKFVKKYAHLGPQIRRAVAAYRQDVKNGKYPDKKHSF